MTATRSSRPWCCGGIGDKLYDKRKAAALEVEQLVKTLAREVLLLPSCRTAIS